MDGEWVPFEVESYEVQNRDGEDATHNVLISNYGELERDEPPWCLLSCWKGGFGPAILWVSLLVTPHLISFVVNAHKETPSCNNNSRL